MFSRDLFTPLSVLFLSIGVVGLAATWIVLARNMARLPETTACHFDLEGRPDSWCKKKGLWGLPLVGTVLFVGIVFLAFLGADRSYPNLPREIENVAISGAFLGGLFFALVQATIAVGLGRRKELGRRFVLMTLASIAAMVIFIAIRS